MSSDTPHEPAKDTVTGAQPDIVEGEVVADPTQPSATPAPSGYTPPIPDPNYSSTGVPTFDFVRDKIENRISTAIGREELAQTSPEGQQVDEMMRKRDEAAKKKLDEIRKSMGK